MFAEYLTGSTQDWASVLPSDSQAQTLTRGSSHEQRVSRGRNVWGQERNLKRGGSLSCMIVCGLSVTQPNSPNASILFLPSNFSWLWNLMWNIARKWNTLGCPSLDAFVERFIWYLIPYQVWKFHLEAKRCFQGSNTGYGHLLRGSPLSVTSKSIIGWLEVLHWYAWTMNWTHTFRLKSYPKPSSWPYSHQLKPNKPKKIINGKTQIMGAQAVCIKTVTEGLR